MVRFGAAVEALLALPVERVLSAHVPHALSAELGKGLLDRGWRWARAPPPAAAAP